MADFSVVTFATRRVGKGYSGSHGGHGSHAKKPIAGESRKHVTTIGLRGPVHSHTIGNRLAFRLATTDGLSTSQRRRHPQGSNRLGMCWLSWQLPLPRWIM